MNDLPPKSNGLKDIPTDISPLVLEEIPTTFSQDIQPESPIPSMTAPEEPKKSGNSFKRQLGKVSLLVLLVVGIVFYTLKDVPKTISVDSEKNDQILSPLTESKAGYEVFGFAPYWTFNKLDSVDFETLTTLAYFGIDAKPDGSLDRAGKGYETFMSPEATALFKKAHKHKTRVVLTITQMNNDDIKAILDNPEAQQSTINQSVALVKDRGIDGINIDFEYVGNPGTEYQDKFSAFSKNFTDTTHREIPHAKVTASVYASAAKDPKMYNIKTLADSVDGIFMMAYDFAVASSKNAIPTAPLYGHKEGKYWYDISTAVDHFLAQMPANKLILGVPWYGYNYAVESPEVKTATTKGYYTSYKKGRKTYRSFVPLKSYAQTSSLVNNVTANTPGITNYQEGFDEHGKVSWKAYYDTASAAWRMVFIDDSKSLSYKYGFVKDKKLAGVGMWALGFDDGKGEVWSLLKDKFGTKNTADAFVGEVK